MSLNSYMWATKQRTGSPTANFLLRELADCVDMRGYCSLNITKCCYTTEMTREEVVEALVLLVKYDYITVNWDLEQIRLHIPTDSVPA